MKNKDDIIKKITQEKDHYKYNTPSHYSINSCDFKPPQINKKKVETVHCKKLSLGNLEIMDDYILNTDICHTDRTFDSEFSNYSKSDSKGGKSNSIIKYFKNIFKSGKLEKK